MRRIGAVTLGALTLGVSVDAQGACVSQAAKPAASAGPVNGLGRQDPKHELLTANGEKG